MCDSSVQEFQFISSYQEMIRKPVYSKLSYEGSQNTAIEGFDEHFCKRHIFVKVICILNTCNIYIFRDFMCREEYVSNVVNIA